jgi:hypothetical protein
MNTLLALYLWSAKAPSCDTVNQDLMTYSCVYTNNSGTKFLCYVDNSDNVGNRPSGQTPFMPQRCDKL